MKNEWDCGVVMWPWIRHEDHGRITVIEQPGGDYEVVHHRFDGPFKGDELLAIFDDLKEARNFGWSYYYYLRDDLYEEPVREPLRIDWDKVSELQRLYKEAKQQDPDTRIVGFVVGLESGSNQ